MYSQKVSLNLVKKKPKTNLRPVLDFYLTFICTHENGLNSYDQFRPMQNITKSA